MKYNLLHIICASALLLTACSEDDGLLPGADNVSTLSVTVTDGAYISETGSRAAENGYTTEFTPGDACGLYIIRNGVAVYENVKLTAAYGTDGTIAWQPESGITIAGGLSGERYFLYYPYQEDMTGKTDATATDDGGFFATLINSWQPAGDQSDYATGYTASDLMTATGTAAKADGKLSLNFAMTHRMALAVIEMPKTVYKFTDTSIPDYTGPTAADFTAEAKPYRNSDGTYRYLVRPQQANASSLTGSYADGMKEFTITPNNISASSYKTYKVDGVALIEKEYNLQSGDYFCKNSDDKWYIIPQEATPDGNVIGIVFHVGQHATDQSDYTSTGIGQKKCHGYVVALTDVYNDISDRLRWERGPTQQYDQVVGTSTSTTDWQGYSNSRKFHEFVNKNTGWEMKHFPAPLACETYGKRTLDHDGNDTDGEYDWQQPLAAPSNTSGWFLPSCGQLKYLYQYRTVLSARMTEVKNSIPTDCTYKEKINWFSTRFYYWSSTEDPSKSEYAWGVWPYSGGSNGAGKFSSGAVRAILAF